MSGSSGGVVPALAPSAFSSASSSTAPPASPTASASRRRRPWLKILLVIALFAAILASVFRGLYQDGPLAPDAPTGQGSKAVVQVLEDLGVEVDVDRHTSDAAAALDDGSTVLVTAPRDLSGEQLTALAEAQETGGGRLVLVQPDATTLSYLSPAITPSGALRDPGQVEAGPGCLDLAHRARVLEVSGDEGIRGTTTLYRADAGAGAEECFRSGDDSLVVQQDGVLVLGSADLLTNDGVGRADNSALVLNALGESGSLSWYVPSSTDPMAPSSPSLIEHLPDWAGPLVLWLLLVTVMALVAAGRRFGPVVVEPLPVTVKPQELVLGRARLLQRAGARDAAATALRSAAATRLADRLGLRHESSLDGLLSTLSPHVELTSEQLRRLLGPTPVTSDQDLVRLALDLDRLEKEIDR